MGPAEPLVRLRGLVVPGGEGGGLRLRGRLEPGKRLFDPADRLSRSLLTHWLLSSMFAGRGKRGGPRKAPPPAGDGVPRRC